jgi:site-specific recombinase XerD
MPQYKIALPALAHAFLATRQGRHSRPDLCILHRWMNENNLELTDLTAAHMEHFWQHQQFKTLAPSTMSSRREHVHRYLLWLYEHGHLRFVVEPTRYRHMRAPLPESARRFLKLRGNRQYMPRVRNLHYWMQRKHIALDQLTQAHINAFLHQPIGVQLGKQSRYNLSRRIEPYLLWLYDRGLIHTRLNGQIRRAFELPQSALDFIDTLQPVLKHSTCYSYLGDLRAFHAWLAESNLDVQHFDRVAAERWLKSMADRSLSATTRKGCIFQVRKYLYWLSERGTIAADPGDVLRSQDLPKLPSCLPRPFPVQADRELQRRFVASGTLYGQALFVMRRSGMRIGELARLEPSCLERDSRGNSFIKVPLGNLDNERLVPLDDQTRDVLISLQHQCPPGSQFLLLPALSRRKLMERLVTTLKQVAIGLDIPGAVVSHRLRHTYATELLNAGLPLVTIMQLLGHRSFHMTMCYAAITQQTIVDNYHEAMTAIARKYDTIAVSCRQLADDCPERQALNLIYALRKNYHSSDSSKSRVEAIIKRIYKIHEDILALAQSAQNS